MRTLGSSLPMKAATAVFAASSRVPPVASAAFMLPEASRMSAMLRPPCWAEAARVEASNVTSASNGRDMAISTQWCRARSIPRPVNGDGGAACYLAARCRWHLVLRAVARPHPDMRNERMKRCQGVARVDGGRSGSAATAPRTLGGEDPGRSALRAQIESQVVALAAADDVDLESVRCDRAGIGAETGSVRRARQGDAAAAGYRSVGLLRDLVL